MTTLQKVIDEQLSIPFAALPSDAELVRDIQERLGKIGFIDIAVVTVGTLDEKTSSSLEKFKGLARQSSDTSIGSDLARKFLDITRNITLPLASDADVVISLTGSIGKNGTNISSEVLAVKNRLADLGFRVERDSSINTKTIEAIKLFQAIINGRDDLRMDGWVDGRIDPNKRTHKALQKSFAPRWQEMLPGSVQEGFLNSDFLAKLDNGDFGTTWMTETIKAAGLIYHNNYFSTHPQATLIAVNDISRENGGIFPPHNEHQVGLCCDIYLPRKDGNSGQVEVSENIYDRDAMRAILTAFHQQTKHPIVLIYLNDSILSNEKITIAGKQVNLCTLQKDHKNHAHVKIRPSNLSSFLALS
jgi:hypothetical protein